MSGKEFKIGKRGIKVGDVDTVKEALRAVNGRAGAYVADYQDVADAAGAAEDRLCEKGVSVKNRLGATVVFSTAGPSSQAYKYSVAASKITMFRAREGWRVSSIERIYVYPKTKAKFGLTVPSAAGEDIQRHAFGGIAIAA